MDTLIALGLFLIIQIVIQHYERKARAMLSTEEKAKLLDSSSQFYFMQMGPTVILLLAFGGFLYLKPSILVVTIGLVVYILLIVASSLVSQRMMVNKLSTIGLSDSYIKHCGRSSMFQSVSVIMFCSWILGSTLWMFKGLSN